MNRRRTAAFVRKVDKLGRERGGATFVCPSCHSRSRVLRTTRSENSKAVIRHRRCLKCGTMFETQETMSSYR
jgi:transcription elongation factor Elf1